MGNLGGPEILVIFFVALIVLGPNKLPDAARQVGKAMAEIRRVSGGFQREMREAMQEPLKEVESDFMVRSEELRAKKRAEAAAQDPTGDAVAGDAVTGDAVTGDAVTGDAVTGDAGTGETGQPEADGDL